MFFSIKKHLRAALPTLLFLLMILTLLSIKPNYKDGCRNIHDLESAISLLDEFIEMDRNTPINPTYESFYTKKFSHSYPRRLREQCLYFLYTIGLQNPPCFSPSYFKNLLDDINKTLALHAIPKLIQGKPTTKLVVFGRLQGALHSLCRDLKELISLGILSSNLHLISPDDYIVFLGGTSTRSPYSVETLTVLLKLLKNNPKNVVFLKGRQEVRSFWEAHTLGREIELVFGRKESLRSKIYSKVDCFFQHGQENLLVLLGKESPIPTALFLPVVDEVNSELESFEGKYLETRVIFRDVKWREQYELSRGLVLLSSRPRRPEWSLFSGPTDPAQKGLLFFFDSFAVISCNQWPDKWILTSHAKHIMSKESYKESYDFLTGERIEAS